MRNKRGVISWRFGRTAIGIVALLVGGAGCKDSRTAGKTIFPAAIGTVRYYDVELGPQASPQDVVYVLLRTVRDKRQAVRIKDQTAVTKANEALVSLAAPDAIVAHYKKLLPAQAAARLNRDLSVNETARSWGPVVAHYTDSFPEDRQEMEKRMQTVADGNNAVDVLFPVQEETYHSSAVIRVRLVREKGYWRVWNVGFAYPDQSTTKPVVRLQPHQAVARASQPASQQATQGTQP